MKTPPPSASELNGVFGPWVALLVLYLFTVPVIWSVAVTTSVDRYQTFSKDDLRLSSSNVSVAPSTLDPNRERELQVQTVSANAAYGTMVISQWALIVSLVGGLAAVVAAYYVKLTFEQTRAALAFSEDSAKAAWQAVNETIRSNQISERALLLEQRPWLMIQLDDVRINHYPGGTMLHVETTLRNVGKSPALVVKSRHVATRLLIRPPGRSEYWNDGFAVSDSYESILPQGEENAIGSTARFTVTAQRDDPEPSRFILLRMGVLYKLSGHDDLFETVVAFDLRLDSDDVARNVLGEYAHGFEITSKPSQGWMV